MFISLRTQNTNFKSDEVTPLKVLLKEMWRKYSPKQELCLKFKWCNLSLEYCKKYPVIRISERNLVMTSGCTKDAELDLYINSIILRSKSYNTFLIYFPKLSSFLCRNSAICSNTIQAYFFFAFLYRFSKTNFRCYFFSALLLALILFVLFIFVL